MEKNDTGTADARVKLGQALGEMQERLYAFILALTANPQDASDILQETDLEIWKNADAYDPQYPYWPWFKQFALNVVRHDREKQAGEKLVFDSDLLDRLADTVPEVPPPEEKSEKDRARTLAVCLRRLKPWQQDVLKRRYGTGEPLGSLAGSLHVTPVSLSKLIYQFRRALQACIRRLLRKLEKFDEGELLFIKELDDLFDGVATEEEKDDFAARLACAEKWRRLYLSQVGLIALMTTRKKMLFAEGGAVAEKPTFRVHARAAAIAAGLALLLAGGAALFAASRGKKAENAGHAGPATELAAARRVTAAPKLSATVEKPAAPTVRKMPQPISSVAVVAAEAKRKEEPKMKAKPIAMAAAVATVAAVAATAPVKVRTQSTGASYADSAGISLESRSVTRSDGAAQNLESRSKTWSDSAGRNLNSTKFKGLVVMLI